MVTVLKNKCTVCKRNKFLSFWYHLLFYIVRNLFHTIGDLTYQSLLLFDSNIFSSIEEAFKWAISDRHFLPLTDSELSKLDERLIHLLAYQRLQQLLHNTAPSTSLDPQPSPSPSPSPSTTSNPLSPTACTSSQTTQPGVTHSSPSPAVHREVHTVRARAILCPLTCRGSPCSMPYRTLTVGTGQ